MEGQTEESFGVCGRNPSKLERIVAPGRCNLRKGVGNPRRFVPLPPEGNRREVRGVGLHQQAIPRYKPHQVVVRPFVESHDPAERDVPFRVERELGQRVGARIAMEDSEDAGSSGIANDRACIVFGISGVDHDRLVDLSSECDLSGEHSALGFARRVVVVIVESALANRDGRLSKQLAQLRNVARRVERGCVVGMDSSGRKDEPGILRRALGSHCRRRERFPDADDRQRARNAGARDYRVAVAGEGRVREVGVAVDED